MEQLDFVFWVCVGSVFTLLGLSGFFSGSETAMTAVSDARMLGLEKDGNPRAKLVNKIREKKDRLIGALLLGNNLVNILATAVTTSVLTKLFGEAGVAYATLIMTVLVLIFAEVLPKTYALNYADKMAMAIAPIINVLVIVLGPITSAISAIVFNVLKLFGIRTDLTVAGSNVEELRGVIEMHTGQEEEAKRRAMLRSIIDLEDVDIEEIMIHRKNVTSIDGDLPMDKIVDSVLASAYTRLPVWKDDSDNIVGILHARHLLRQLYAANGDTSKLNLDEMTSEPWFVPETTILADQLQAFKDRKEHFAIVIDEYGSFMGICTLEDILEEIVGEIEDEHDIAVEGVRKSQKQETYMVNGDVTIRDLNREFEWELPDDEDYSTVAGLILYQAKMLPRVGQRFTFFGFQFEIIKRQNNQITLVSVRPLDEGE